MNGTYHLLVHPDDVNLFDKHIGIIKMKVGTPLDAY
jgi:hypothetical protein